MTTRAAIFIFLIALTGCDGLLTRRAYISADSWYAPMPASMEDYIAIKNEQFAPVSASFQAEAQARLANLSALQLTAEESKRLVGYPLPGDGVHVLLRAVVLYEGTGRFSIDMKERAVRVHHGCLGRSPATMTRKALVAVLPHLPEQVFVSCSMAE